MTDPHPLMPAAEGWQPAATAPQTATWVQLGYAEKNAREAAIVVAHWASDMSGEEQPPFEGWFRHNLGDRGHSYGFVEAPKGFLAWRPLWPSDRAREAAAHHARVVDLLEANSRGVLQRRQLADLLAQAMRHVFDEAERGRLEHEARMVMTSDPLCTYADAMLDAVAAYEAHASGYPVDKASLHSAFIAFMVAMTVGRRHE